MRKTALALTLTSALLFSMVAGTLFFNVGNANMLFGTETGPPPVDTKPPTIMIESPENRTLGEDKLLLSFNVSTIDSKDTNYISDVYYKTDWQENETSVYHLERIQSPTFSNSWITDFRYVTDLTGIPEGSHRITISAVAQGRYEKDLKLVLFNITGSSSLAFTTEYKPTPEVSIITPELVAAASGASVAVIGLAVLLYFKNRNRSEKTRR
jgi:hypothetical protein